MHPIATAFPLCFARLFGLCLLAVGGLGLAQAVEFRAAPGVSLQELVDRAAPGDRIVLGRGEYKANLIIEKPLELIGEPGSVVHGGGRGDVIRIRASDVVVRGIALRGAGSNLTAMNAAIFVEPTGRGAMIEDNVIEADAFGIWLDGCKAVRVQNNRVHGNPALRSQDRGNGIHLFNVTRVEVIGNEIWEARDGIYIDTSNHNVLRDNYIHHLRYGIHYMYSHDNEVVGNRTHDTRTGYALMQSKHLTVIGNRSEGDENYGMLMNYIVSSTIADNRVTNVRSGWSAGGASVAGAEGKAIFIYNSQFNTIRGNLFGASELGIHLTAGSEDNSIYANAFVGNRTQVKYVATRLQEWSRDGRGNYWSDYLGWDLNADGIGDRPYQPNDGIDRLLWKYPAAKILMHSPAIDTLHWVQEQFPVLRPPGVTDSHPLMLAPGLESAT